jgi:hypothetical protein
VWFVPIPSDPKNAGRYIALGKVTKKYAYLKVGGKLCRFARGIERVVLTVESWPRTVGAAYPSKEEYAHRMRISFEVSRLRRDLYPLLLRVDAKTLTLEKIAQARELLGLSKEE